MNYFKNMILLLSAVFLLHSCVVGSMMPMANKTSSSKVGEKLLSFTAGVVNTRKNNEKKSNK